jgi:hypothetical protein
LPAGCTRGGGIARAIAGAARIARVTRGAWRAQRSKNFLVRLDGARRKRLVTTHVERDVGLSRPAAP